MKKTLTLLVFILAVTLAFAKDEAYPGWKPLKLKTGDTPAGFRFTEMVDKQYANFLEITLLGDADAIVKVRHMVGNEPNESDPLARVVFVKKGNRFQVKNLPLGNYYLEVAFGNTLCVNKENKNRVRFMTDTHFERLTSPFAMTCTSQTLPNGDIAMSISTSQVTLQIDITKIDKKDGSFDVEKEDISENEFYQ